MEQLTTTEPQSLAAYDYLNGYDVLKSYSDHIGVMMDAETFMEKGMAYRIAVNNFSELAPGRVFSHGRVVKANGTIDTDAITKLQKLTTSHGMKLLGTPLVWHQQQNTTYLNARLAPNVIRPEGDDGGYCLKMTNTALATAAASAQVAYTFAKTPQVEPGIAYKIKMMVRGTAEGTVQVQTWSNGKGSRFSPDITVTKEWQKVEAINTMASGIKGLTSILFNLGQYVGTLYVDDIELVEWNANKQKEVGKNLNTVNTNLDDAEQTAASTSVQTDSDGTLEDVGVSELGEGYDPLATYVEKTDVEKRDIVSAEMQRYIDAMMEVGGTEMADWIVVNDPLAEVKDEGSLFYWQQYLGASNYAVEAFKRAAANSNSGKLFVGESGLTGDMTKCNQLIAFIQTVEGQGARVDGIAVSIAADTEATSIDAVKQMFSILAATGKLIRINDLQVAIAGGVTTDEATEQQLKQQATMLENILKTYTTQVPVAQQAGVTLHQVLDTTQPLGLWSIDFDRKHAYGAVCRSLDKR